MKFLMLLSFLSYFSLTVANAENYTLYLNYSCNGVNNSSGERIAKEVEILTANKLLSEPQLTEISLKDVVEGTDISNITNQSGFNQPSIIALRANTNLNKQSVDYVLLRLAGASLPLALELVKNTNGLKWGDYTIDKKLLFKVNLKDFGCVMKSVIDLNNKEFNINYLYGVADGEVLRVLQTDSAFQKVVWELVFDKKDYQDIAFDQVMQFFLKKSNIDFSFSANNSLRLLKLDDELSKGLINWVNPVQISKITDMNPNWQKE